MEQDKQVVIAVAALRRLEELHATLVKHVSSLSDSKAEGGSIAVVDNELTAECLGVKLRAVHRPVVRDGGLMAVEYSFVAMHGDEELVIWTMYLEANGDLYADFKKRDRITSGTNIYLPKYLIAPLVLALLASPLFASRQ